MFTVEFEDDYTVIRSLSDTDEAEDLEVFINPDNTVFLRQWQDYKEEHDVMCITYQQLLDVFSAMNKTAGAYRVEFGE